MLGEDYSPSTWSVICARGKDSFNHTGNRRFRVLCEMNLPKYEAAGTKMEKSVIVLSIVEAVREAGGNFVRQDRRTGEWYDIGDAQAREKTGQNLREMMSKKRPAKRELLAVQSVQVERQPQITVEPATPTETLPSSFANEEQVIDPDSLASLMTAPLCRASSDCLLDDASVGTEHSPTNVIDYFSVFAV